VTAGIRCRQPREGGPSSRRRACATAGCCATWVRRRGDHRDCGATRDRRHRHGGLQVSGYGQPGQSPQTAALGSSGNLSLGRRPEVRIAVPVVPRRTGTRSGSDRRTELAHGSTGSARSRSGSTGGTDGSGCGCTDRKFESGPATLVMRGRGEALAGDASGYEATQLGQYPFDGSLCLTSASRRLELAPPHRPGLADAGRHCHVGGLGRPPPRALRGLTEPNGHHHAQLLGWLEPLPRQ